MINFGLLSLLHGMRIVVLFKMRIFTSNNKKL